MFILMEQNELLRMPEWPKELTKLGAYLLWVVFY